MHLDYYDCAIEAYMINWKELGAIVAMNKWVPCEYVYYYEDGTVECGSSPLKEIDYTGVPVLDYEAIATASPWMGLKANEIEFRLETLVEKRIYTIRTFKGEDGIDRKLIEGTTRLSDIYGYGEGIE